MVRRFAAVACWAAMLCCAAFACAGGITRQVWTGIPGNSVYRLLNDPRYPISPDIEEILHTAITQAKLDHRVELFGYDRFTWIRFQTRRGQIKQRGIVRFGRFRCNCIANPHIDLDADACVAEPASNLHSKPLIDLILADLPNGDRARVELQSVGLYPSTTYIREDGTQDFFRDLPDPSRSKSRVGRSRRPSQRMKSIAPLRTKRLP